jgi:hypothetical protein
MGAIIEFTGGLRCLGCGKQIDATRLYRDQLARCGRFHDWNFPVGSCMGWLGRAVRHVRREHRRAIVGKISRI